MATLTTVQSRNQITIPKEVRRASGVRPGDSVLVRSTGPGKMELLVIPRITFEESLKRFRSDERVDMEQMKRNLEDDLVADVLRTLKDD